MHLWIFCWHNVFSSLFGGGGKVQRVFEAKRKFNIRWWSYRAPVFVPKAAHARPNGLLGYFENVSFVSLREGGTLETAGRIWLLCRLRRLLLGVL